MSLSGSDHLMPYIINPVNNIYKKFISFNSIHILKCIRNNILREHLHSLDLMIIMKYFVHHLQN